VRQGEGMAGRLAVPTARGRPRSGDRTKRWWPLLRFAGTGVGMAILVRHVDIAGVAAGLRFVAVGWALLAVALSGLSLLANVGQWGLLLRGTGHELRWRTLVSWYLQGAFVGQVVPAGGDVLRTVETARGCGAGPALAAVAAGRMTGAVAMGVWGLAGALLDVSSTGATMLVVMVLFVVLLMAACAVALWSHQVAGAVTQRWTWPSLRRLRSFTQAFHDYRERPGLLCRCMIVALIGWGVNLCAVEAFAHSAGVDAPWTLFAVAVPAMLVAGLFPLSVNGVGVREGALVGVLLASGVTAVHAGMMAVFIDLQTMPFAILGAALWLRRSQERRLVVPGPSTAPSGS
jgi:uncharacterized membrane protein YbhN (UPF0104 family)